MYLFIKVSMDKINKVYICQDTVILVVCHSAETIFQAPHYASQAHEAVKKFSLNGAPPLFERIVTDTDRYNNTAPNPFNTAENIQHVEICQILIYMYFFCF